MTRTAKTIELLRAGWLTPLESAMRGGCLALSQRVSELRAANVVVRDKWVRTRTGCRCKAYRIGK